METALFEPFPLPNTENESTPASTRKSKYNWCGAFVEYCRGSSLDDVAAIHEIPLPTLRARADADSWELNRLKAVSTFKKLDATPYLKPDDIEKRQAISREVRAETIEIAKLLMKDARRVAESIAEDGGTTERQWQFQGQVIRADIPMTSSEKLQFATYVQSLANTIYSALGESQGGGRPSEGGNMQTSNQPHVTIVLPGVIGAPRAEREAITIDLSNPPPT